MAIISISGKKTSGKDTVGKIIQILINSPHFTNEAVEDFLKREIYKCSFEIRKFADSLKDMLCMMIGCTREQLEDEEFKNTELGEEWWYWKLEREGGYNTILLPYNENTGTENYTLIKPTPRLLLQLMGTECGRDIIHPNVWVNALFSKYKPYRFHDGNGHWINSEEKKLTEEFYKQKDNIHVIPVYPDWIITDMRFPNELKAVEDRNGVTIRINRPKYSRGLYKINAGKRVIAYSSAEGMEEFDKAVKEKLGIVEHISETALDNTRFNYTIDNNEGILELIQKVKEILIKEKFI